MLYSLTDLVQQRKIAENMGLAVLRNDDAGVSSASPPWFIERAVAGGLALSKWRLLVIGPRATGPEEPISTPAAELAAPSLKGASICDPARIPR